ncbi:hypothetical protein SAMN04489761_2806 [Tenacibaculum sp. MAR_2009_124]|nr:hypothetical protein SAMN04489761_2806 [Tenacibaculum sp. MAR_2009_124]
MLDVAQKYIEKKAKMTNLPLILYKRVTKRDYGNIYGYTSKDYFETKEEKYAIAGNAPFLVEKETGRVVNFGTAFQVEEYIKAYENNTMSKSLDLYWYPDEDRFDYK